MFTTPAVTGLSSLKIMFMGDSITTGVGSTSQGGFRTALMQTIASRLGTKCKPIFVGSQYTNMGSAGLCGASGLRVDEVTATPYAAVQLKQYAPDVIFLHIGTNDCTQLNTGGTPTLATTRTNLTALLDLVRLTLPNCIVFIAKIVDNSTAHTEVVNFNAGAIDTDVVARSDYASGKVVVVDQYTGVGLYSATTFADGSHPNAVGYALMAPTWQTAFNTKF